MKNDLENIRFIIKGWKLQCGIPVDGEESKDWDKVHFKRYARSAKSLLILFKTWQEAVNCIQYVYEDMKKKGMDCTIETVVKRSDTYREQLERRPT